MDTAVMSVLCIVFRTSHDVYRTIADALSAHRCAGYNPLREWSLQFGGSVWSQGLGSGGTQRAVGMVMTGYKSCGTTPEV